MLGRDELSQVQQLSSMIGLQCLFHMIWRFAAFVCGRFFSILSPFLKKFYFKTDRLITAFVFM